MWSYCGVMLVEQSCLRPSTHLHCHLKAYKAFETTPQLNGNVVTARQPLKLPISSIFCCLATGGVILSYYGVMLVEQSCLGPITHLHCPLKAYKALATPVELYGNVVTARQPFKLPIGSIFGCLASWGVMWSYCDVMLVEQSCLRPITQLGFPL